MQSDLIDALQLLVETSLGDVNTSVPGTVVSYDAAKNRAVVKPAFPKMIANGDTLDAPQIVEVPIVWPASGGGSASFTMPLKPGDGVMLSFQQRSLEGWLAGKTEAPDDPRTFDLSDCVAIPGCSATGTTAHEDDVVLKFGESEVRIKPGNIISIGNAKGGVTIDADGNMTLKAQSIKVDTPARSFTLELHRHQQTKSDNNDQSGIPAP